MMMMMIDGLKNNGKRPILFQCICYVVLSAARNSNIIGNYINCKILKFQFDFLKGWKKAFDGTKLMQSRGTKNFEEVGLDHKTLKMLLLSRVLTKKLIWNVTESLKLMLPLMMQKSHFEFS